MVTPRPAGSTGATGHRAQYVALPGIRLVATDPYVPLPAPPGSRPRPCPLMPVVEYSRELCATGWSGGVFGVEVAKHVDAPVFEPF